MASWLSAGSVDDGTVVRRVSANADLKFNAPDLFSPSKLESIFTKDESAAPHDESDENLSFIPSPVKIGPYKLREELVVSRDYGSVKRGPSSGHHERVMSRGYGSIKPAMYDDQEWITASHHSDSTGKASLDELEEVASSRDYSSIKAAEDLSFIPSPVKRRGIKDLDDLTISGDLDAMKAWEQRSMRLSSGPVKPSDETSLPHVSTTPKPAPSSALLDESSLPSDLSHGTSFSIKPKRQSLGTGDYLSEASRVMTYLRQNRAATQASYDESPSISSNSRSSNSAPASLNYRRHNRAVTPAQYDEQLPESPSFSGHRATSGSAPLPEPELIDHIAGADRDTTVVRSPEKHVDWVEQASPKLPQDPFAISVADRDTTVLRSPEKHVDWVEYASPKLSQSIQATPKYSILSLTPLPDFTVHEDDPQHPERSFVDQRAHNRALRQAHGTLALSRDALIQAITDVRPDELYWEEITELDLEGKGLASLHGLDEICPNLVVLNVSDNSLTHLNGVPSSIRELNVARNLLSDMVCWTGLKNLHLLNISANKNITSLDGFCDLVHLRTLRATKCSINNIDGIKVLDGLLDLQLQSNKLRIVDFGKTNFSQLESLDLSCNKLESATNLNKLPALVDLHLSHNFLTEIVPMGRRGPRDLEILEADHNLVDAFNLKQYPNLRYAMLDFNRLNRIHGLGKTPYFEELSVRNQDVTSDIVNRILTTPNDCNTLILSGNPVPNGGLELPELPQHSLRALELTDCGIKQLGAGFGKLFPNIRLLNLSYNHIQELTDLRGMVKIRRLEMIRNRISRMRRTCLLLARLPSLSVLDIRDNPLTMAFHPVKGEDAEADAKWLRTLDENTKMRRRLTELLLAEHCKQLQQFDGLAFEPKKVLKKEEVWRKCEEKGALREQ